MRDESVTISKGIGIMLMVLAHSGFSQFGDAVINMFHMPLFFFMSGYCFKEKYLNDMKAFFVKKVKGIYWPYVKWSIFFLLLHNVFFQMGLYTEKYSLSTIFIRLFHIFLSMALHDQLLGGYWFLHCLFWGSLFAYLIFRYTRRIGLLGGGIPLFIWLIMKLIDKNMPVLAINSGDMLATFFIFSGYWYKKEEGRIKQRQGIIIPIGLILMVLGALYWKGCVPILDIWKVLPYCITALAGTLAVFSVSKMLQGKARKFVVFIGDNTLTVLTWHFLCFKLVTLLIVFIYSADYKENMSQFPVVYSYARQGWWILYFCVGMIIPLLAAFIKTHLQLQHSKKSIIR